MFFPSLPLLCELAIERWRIEVVEDSVSLVRRSANKVCHYCNSYLLIEIFFPFQFICILNMNIESIDLFDCLYMIDYIFYSSANTFIYIVLSLFAIVERKL